jgi:hypothetical protein
MGLALSFGSIFTQILVIFVNILNTLIAKNITFNIQPACPPTSIRLARHGVYARRAWTLRWIQERTLHIHLDVTFVDEERRQEANDGRGEES